MLIGKKGTKLIQKRNDVTIVINIRRIYKAKLVNDLRKRAGMIIRMIVKRIKKLVCAGLLLLA